MLDIYAIEFYRKEIKFRDIGRWLFCMWRLGRNLKEFKRVQMPQNENKSGVFKELPEAATRRREEKLIRIVGQTPVHTGPSVAL